MKRNDRRTCTRPHMRARARRHRQRSHSVERPCDLYRIFIALTRTWRGYKRLGWVSVGCGARCSCACVFVRFIVNSLGCHTFNLAYRYRDVCTLEVVGSHRIATHTRTHARTPTDTPERTPFFVPSTPCAAVATGAMSIGIDWWWMGV